jgi:purine-nucleoside phosphorylase
MNDSSNSKLAVILGSGLDVLMEMIPEKSIIFENSTGFHSKRIYQSVVNNENILFFCGRSHFYEGVTDEIILKNVNKAKELGAKYLLITNAAGGINTSFRESDLMLINSHVNFNRRFNVKKISYYPYNKEFMEQFRNICKTLKIKIHDGIYGCAHGPAYETSSEVRMLRNAGIDAIGMSTVPEVLEGYSNNLKILGLSVITNILRENDIVKTNHNEILKSAGKASGSILQAIKKLIIELN